MKTRTVLMLMAPVLLAGCSKEPAQNSGGEAEKPAAVAAANGADTSCDGLPPYAPLVADAKVSVCTQGEYRPGHVGGSVSFTTAMAPDAVIAFYKEKAASAGLKPGMAAPGAYSAIDGTKRTMMVMPTAQGGGSQVMLNWGMDK